MPQESAFEKEMTAAAIRQGATIHEYYHGYLEDIKETKHMTYDCHSDAGHGWLKVKRNDLLNAGVASEISSYSSPPLVTVYAEEELDAGTFLNALFEKPTRREINDGDSSTNRNFDSYEYEAPKES